MATPEAADQAIWVPRGPMKPFSYPNADTATVNGVQTGTCPTAPPW